MCRPHLADYFAVYIESDVRQIINVRVPHRVTAEPVGAAGRLRNQLLSLALFSKGLLGTGALLFRLGTTRLGSALVVEAKCLQSAEYPSVVV